MTPADWLDRAARLDWTPQDPPPPTRTQLLFDALCDRVEGMSRPGWLGVGAGLVSVGIAAGAGWLW